MRRMIGMLVVVWLANPLYAQLGPQSYALSHLLSSIQGPAVEAAGRGGAFGAIPDPWSGNPAHVLTNFQQVIIHSGINDFKTGTTFRYQSIKLVTPLSKKWGLMINGATLVSNKAKIALLPIPIPTFLKVKEQNFTFSIARRINSRLTLGISEAPVMDVDIRIDSPPGKMFRIRSKDDYGARFGGQWEVSRNLSLGFVYDNYYEKSRLTDFVSGPLPIKVGGKYHSVFIRTGLAYQNGKTLIAADWLSGTHSGPFGYKKKIKGFYWGGDQKIRPNLILRAGFYDRNLTVGFTYQGHEYQIRYAYVKDISSDELSSLLGSSRTHYLMVQF